MRREMQYQQLIKWWLEVLLTDLCITTCQCKLSHQELLFQKECKRMRLWFMTRLWVMQPCKMHLGQSLFKSLRSKLCKLRSTATWLTSRSRIATIIINWLNWSNRSLLKQLFTQMPRCKRFKRLSTLIFLKFNRWYSSGIILKTLTSQHLYHLSHSLNKCKLLLIRISLLVLWLLARTAMIHSWNRVQIESRDVSLMLTLSSAIRQIRLLFCRALCIEL